MPVEDHIVMEFFTSAKQGTAQLIGRVASNDSEVTELELTGNQELIIWPPQRQQSALLVLARNTHVKRAVLSNLQLVDSVASVLAGVLRVNTTLTSLNVENNILNEASLCEIAHALASNSTLLELKIAHQKKQIPTAVEEALANALEKNTTLSSSASSRGRHSRASSSRRRSHATRSSTATPLHVSRS